MSTKVFTVSQLNTAIKGQLEENFRYISVQGEISNLKAQASGHFYFSLKDNQSQISAVLFRGSANRLSRTPKEGDQVIIRGEISVYSPRGVYQIIVRELEFSGRGELLLKLHQYKEELRKKGWLDSTLKKSLPKIPQKIGIVTSPTGAVIQDILHVLERRFSGFHLILNPVKVQGQGAAEEIAQAIRDFNKYRLADVLIIGRGGGSIEDLWAFNEPVVAEAIFHSEIPIISAVGHETDYSISDLIADVRAPTPSAAAEIVISEKERIQQWLIDLKGRIEQQLTHRIQSYRTQLAGYKKHPILSESYFLLNRFMQRHDEMKEAISLSMDRLLTYKKSSLEAAKKQHQALKPQSQIRFLAQKLDQQKLQLLRAISYQIVQKKEKLTHIKTHLDAIDPKHLLKKGYSILFSEKNHSIILSTNNLKSGDKVKAHLHDGSFEATIDSITP